VALRYEPPGSVEGPVLGLVGKGITFDTGGISIKPAAEMDRMKDDMAGGAAVACAIRAMKAMNAPVRAVGVIPIAENMPGSRAYRPGDVIKSAEGCSPANTDAEGRLLWAMRPVCVAPGRHHLVIAADRSGGRRARQPISLFRD
jgi:leucyl aminopeptidase